MLTVFNTENFTVTLTYLKGEIGAHMLMSLILITMTFVIRNASKHVSKLET